MSVQKLTQADIDGAFVRVVLNGDKEDVAFFAEFVDNPNVPDKYGRTAVWAALQGSESYEKMKTVLSLNPDINSRNFEGQTPLMHAWEKRKIGAGLLLLKDRRTDINAVDKKGYGLMHYAVFSRSQQAVTAAAEAHVPLMQQDKKGLVPAYYAVLDNDLDVFEALIRAGMKPDADNAAYQPVLEQAHHRAVIEKSNNWIRAAEQGVFPERSWDQRYTTDAETLLYRFLKLSADKQFEVNQMLDNIFEMSGEHWQLRPNAFSDTKTVSDLLKEQLLFQVRYGRVDDVTVLLKLGANPEVSDVYGRTALYLATDFTSQDEQNMTPEEEAAQAYKKVLALLLAGARPNSANLVEKDGLLCFDDTPLRHSLIKKRIGISVLLVRAGAKFETDQYGDGPVKVAVMYSKPEAIEMLAKFGADLMQQDKNGRTPLECAIMADKPYHVAMLRHYLIHREDTKALFDKTQEEGRRLKALAEKQGEKMIQAWCGTLPLSARPKKKKAGKHPKTLKQKINALSEENKRRLYNFVDIPYFPEENTSKAAASSVTAADEKHFPVKMSLLWHKRQR